MAANIARAVKPYGAYQAEASIVIGKPPKNDRLNMIIRPAIKPKRISTRNKEAESRNATKYPGSPVPIKNPIGIPAKRMLKNSANL